MEGSLSSIEMVFVTFFRLAYIFYISTFIVYVFVVHDLLTFTFTTKSLSFCQHSAMMLLSKTTERTHITPVLSVRHKNNLFFLPPRHYMYLMLCFILCMCSVFSSLLFPKQSLLMTKLLTVLAQRPLDNLHLNATLTSLVSCFKNVCCAFIIYVFMLSYLIVMLTCLHG